MIFHQLENELHVHEIYGIWPNLKCLSDVFLKEAVESGLGLKQSHTWNQFGEGRRLKLVETIDEKLIELAEDLVG